MFRSTCEKIKLYLKFEEYVEIVEELKELGYKKIVVYTKGYEYLRTTEEFKEAIYEGSGLDDCGCD